MSMKRKKIDFKAMMNDLASKSSVLYELSEDDRSSLKKCLLEIYKDVNSVCLKYGLDLIGSGGTALGSYRHHGFIPWDDDMDFNMARSDCEKLKKIFELELGDKYLLSCPNYKNKPYARFFKIYKKGTTFIGLEGEKASPCNIFIDIFPIDNVPENRILRTFKGYIAQAIMFIASRVQSYETKNDDVFAYRSATKESLRMYKSELLIGRLFSFMSFEQWVNFLDKYLAKTKKSIYCNVPTGRKHYFGSIKEWDDFYPVSQGKFEGMDMKLPNNIHKYLTSLYGASYMQIPPVDKRERHFVLKFDANSARQKE